MDQNKPQKKSKKSPRRLPSSPASERSSARERMVKALRELDLRQFVDYRDFLQQIYAKTKTTRKAYSYKRFAADLGLSESNVLWLVLSERRDLSEGSAEKIADRLPFSMEEKKYFQLLVKHNNSRSPDVREACLKEMLALSARFNGSEDQEKVLEYYGEWYHPVIRELVGLDIFKEDPDWINDRLFLKITPRRIEKSLELLQALGLIYYDRDRERFLQTTLQVMPDRAVHPLAAIRYHQKACEIAKESVAGVVAARRDLNVLTLSMTDEAAEELKKMLYEFCIRAMELEKSVSKKDQVYQLNVQLFALTKP